MWQTFLEIATVIGGLAGLIQLVRWGRELIRKQGITARGCLQFLVVLVNGYILAVPTAIVLVSLVFGWIGLIELVKTFVSGHGGGIGDLQIAAPLEILNKLAIWSQDNPWLAGTAYFAGFAWVIHLQEKAKDPLFEASILLFGPLLIDLAGVLLFCLVGGIAHLFGGELLSWQSLLNVALGVHYLTWFLFIWPKDT